MALLLLSCLRHDGGHDGVGKGVRLHREGRGEVLPCLGFTLGGKTGRGRAFPRTGLPSDGGGVC